MMGGYSEEFPLLAAHSLYAAEIRGDGNCLFNALSDQLYGHQNDHSKIRARVIDYMREHAAYYKQFIDVHPGGGQRRNPKRKNAGVYSTPTTFVPPTPEQIDRVFESHLDSMARGGTYGDNMELSAFTSAFGIDVKIYQHDFAYMIPAPDTGNKRQIAHIAYHTWEHYSSVRNANGPHTGPPQVNEKKLSQEDEARNQAAAEKVSRVLPWQIQVVSSSLPYLADKDTIKRTIEEYKGNIDAAVSALLDAEDRASISSQPGSSSTERDPDSDDEAMAGPNKKQDRRMSRATKAAQKHVAEQKARALEAESKAQEVTTIKIPPSPSVELPVRNRKPSAAKVVLKTEDDGWATPSDGDEDDEFRPDLDEADEDVASDHSAVTRIKSTTVKTAVSKPTIKITINAGKTHVRTDGPQKARRTTARERVEQKKAAQKAARKEGKRGAVPPRLLEQTSINAKANARPVDLGMGIKTLYI